MYRIDGGDNITPKPAKTGLGSPGWFQDSEPTGGTIVPAEFMNTLQDEIAGVVEGAGLSLDKANDLQLLSAVNALILAGGGGGGGMANKDYFTGMNLKSAADGDHDITIEPGGAMDTTNTLFMNNVADFTKQIDANWAEGDNAGGFPSGLTLSADTFYNVFQIAKPDGTVDFGFDSSSTATNLLSDAAGSGYTLYRYIHTIYTDGSNNIRRFRNNGDVMRYETPINDLNITNLGVSGRVTGDTLDMSVPSAAGVEALFTYSIKGNPTTGDIFHYLVNADSSLATPPSVSLHHIASISNSSINDQAQNSVYLELDVSTAAQLKLYFAGTFGGGTFGGLGAHVVTWGYRVKR